MYAASHPITLTSAINSSDVQGKLAVINHHGRVLVASHPRAHIVGVFAENEVRFDRPCVIDQLTGKLVVRAESPILAGSLVIPGDGGLIEGTDIGVVESGTQIIGVALRNASAGSLASILASHLGYDENTQFIATAGETASEVLDEIVTVNAMGRIIKAAATTASIIGTFAQDEIIDNMPVRVNRLTGILNFVAGGAVTAGQVLVTHATDGRVRSVDGIAGVQANHNGFAVALEDAVADDHFEAICAPIGMT